MATKPKNIATGFTRKLFIKRKQSWENKDEQATGGKNEAVN